MLVSHFRFEPVLNKLKYISLWGILLSSLVGCKPPHISIEQISPKKIGKIVYLTGKVVHLAPFVDNTAYQIEDITGKIWIITTQQAPKLGQKISIKGKIEYQSLPFADRELGDFYLVELEQLPPTTEQTN
ncbi:hypothetical protein I4641_10765 [Waterburya agarophytonicola K14]|uniref:Uncharacterized protein n=1 Tax=Waterburya agarophytonicola KI4 TaxID=2874699 RepID=A0A964BS12_9CYAN|nr:hypothetical protein [Waterburya agarophytonicola]MCC0177458.1 hypothetical protein [Waterburya agarophytonicola KI4]